MGERASDSKKELLELDDPSGVESSEGPISARNVPTIIPAFDPIAVAEQSAIRERAPTLTDEVALEQARIASMPTRPPPARPAGQPFRDSYAEIDAGEESLEALPEDEQIAVLADRMSPMTRVPVLARPLTELGALLEDPKTAYVLGFVDGLLPLQTIVDVTGLPELDTLRVLDRMISQGAVVFR